MPNRILRDWTDSKTMDKLSADEERLFTRLIMKADDYGNFYRDAALVKSLAFPRKNGLRTDDIDRWLSKLESTGLILCYPAKGDSFLHIVNYGQRLDKRSRRFPEEPPDCEKNILPESPGNSGVKRNETETNLESETETKRSPSGILFSDFIKNFNEITGGKFREVEKVRKQFNLRIKEGYTPEQMLDALRNLNANEWYRNNGHVTPEFITKAEKLEKFMNIQKIESVNDGLPNGWDPKFYKTCDDKTRGRYHQKLARMHYKPVKARNGDVINFELQKQTA
jgi:hypothetical protein